MLRKSYLKKLMLGFFFSDVVTAQFKKELKKGGPAYTIRDVVDRLDSSDINVKTQPVFYELKADIINSNQCKIEFAILEVCILK